MYLLFRFATKVDIEMDGKMLNSHGVDFLDGPLGLDLDEKDLDEEETRRDMAKILKELKQKHPDKEVRNVDIKSNEQVFVGIWEEAIKVAKKQTGGKSLILNVVFPSCSN